MTTADSMKTSDDAAKEGARAYPIMHAAVPRVRWGDEKAGFVSDWVYFRTPQIVAIVFSMPPGGSFKVSDDWMPRYDAQECQYVLAGEYTCHNPTTGEVRVAKEGQAVAFGRMNWHYGYNFGDRELRVIEWLMFSSDPISKPAEGTRPGREVGVDPQLMGHWPERRQTRQHMELVTEENSLRAILGAEHQVTASILTSTSMLTVAVVEVAGGRRSDQLRHSTNTLLFIEHGRTHVYVAEQNVWGELNDYDAFFVPAGVGYQLLNQSDRRSRTLLATAGPSLET
jgi:mannose-6-phosphate isomerase-like protein (cupin superfamily)